MKVNRSELKNILAALQPGLAKKEFIPQTIHYIFFDNMVATYNDKICIMHPFTCEEQFSVKGMEFFRLIDGMNDEVVTITIDKGKLKIRSKSTSSTLATIPDTDNTLISVIKTLQGQMKEWKKVPKDFTDGILLCAFSASADLTNGVRACVSVKDNICSSLDSARASLYEMESSIEDQLFIVAREAFELAKFAVREYCTDGKWVHFRTEDEVTFSCKLLTGKWPDNFRSKFAALETLEHIKLPDDMKTNIDSVFVLASDLLDKSGKLLEVTIQDGEIFIKASNELGWVEKNIRCDYKGEPIQLTINAKFMSQILDKAASFVCKDRLLHFSAGTFQHILTQPAEIKRKEN